MFYSSEPIPALGVAPDSDPLTCLTINTEWVSLLVGLVEFMLWPDFWSGTPGEIDQAVSWASQLAGMLIGGDCMSNEVCTIYQQSASAGGAASAGWQTRLLSGMDGSPSWCVLDTGFNRFRPSAGRYLIHASAPFYRVGNSILRLASTGSPSTVLEGLTAHSNTTYGDCLRAMLQGLFNANGVDYFYFSHYCTNAKATNGLGVAPAAGVTGYHTVVTLWRLGDLVVP